MLKARRGDDHVEAPEALERGVDGCPVALGRGEVGADVAVTSGFQVDSEHIEAVAFQALADGGADAAGAAGHKCDARHGP